MFIEVKTMFFDRDSMAYVECKGKLFLNPDDVASINVPDDESTPASLCFKGDSHGQYLILIRVEDAMKFINR